MGSATSLARWLPPAMLVRLKPLVRRGIYFSGRYPSWGAARARSTGYEDAAILERVRDATAKVRSGQAAYERDSVLFTEPAFPYPILAVLLRAAVENHNRLFVLDVGGALGSSYFQCHPFLSALSGLLWRVVEQDHFVDCGRAHFANDQLTFHRSVAEGAGGMEPQVALLSSVLQYLPEPQATLAELVGAGARYIVIDRTPFAAVDRSFVTVQHVPAHIYPATYPCWVFARDQVLSSLRGHYDVVAEFPTDDGPGWASGHELRFAGIILRRR